MNERESLLGATQRLIDEGKEGERELRNLCSHIKTALSTESGRVLKEWLRDECFMSRCTTKHEIDSISTIQAINSRRDLFLLLEAHEKEGVAYVNDN